MTWHVNEKDSAINQKYYQINGIYTISKTCHQGQWRYHLWKHKKIGTFASFDEAAKQLEVEHES